MLRPRIKRLLQQLEARGLAALFVSNPFNVSYLTGSRSRDSYLLVAKSKTVYFTDPRYLTEARARLKDLKVSGFTGPLWESVAREAAGLGLASLGYEDSHLTVGAWRDLQKALPERFPLRPAGGVVEELRLVKSTDEIKELRRACAITVEALDFAREIAVPGTSELEAAGELERFIRRRGAYSSSFDIIVASGPNTSLPHHVTSERKIKKNEPVYVDMGVDYRGYRSDLTRVFFVSKITALVQRTYKTVLEAQARAIRRIRPGVAVSLIDSCARGYISSKGFGKYFRHALGHGVGLEVHEAPRIAPASRTLLREGMVFTIEPAIYLPGRFGVRVEDMVLVTRKGCEVLSGSLNK